jgi:hypothetical protein
MTEYVTVKITGTFPLEDVSMLAQFYGIGSGGFGQPVELTEEEKLVKLVELAQSRLADFLATPAKHYVQSISMRELQQLTVEIDDRVKQGLSYEIVNA